MRAILCLFTGLVLASLSCAQASFEFQGPTCGYTFPIGCGAPGDPEGVSCNGLAPSTVDLLNGAGMPCTGTQYVRIEAFNPSLLNPPSGGPQPDDNLVNELYIPIPQGATSVTFCWDFYNAEGAPSAGFNDGMAIEVTPSACGPRFSTLVYADTFTPLGTGIDSGSGCGSLAVEVAPAGPQTLGPIALPPGAAFLRVKVWNGGDNSVSSSAVIDNVSFTLLQPCSLTIGAPLGPGSLAVFNSGCVPGDSYLTAVTFDPGIYPQGWFFGVDIPWSMLLIEFTSGPPFSGSLDASGNSLFLIPAGMPSGLSIYAVTATFTPGFGQHTGTTPLVSFITP